MVTSDKIHELALKFYEDDPSKPLEVWEAFIEIIGHTFETMWRTGELSHDGVSKEKKKKAKEKTIEKESLNGELQAAILQSNAV